MSDRVSGLVAAAFTPMNRDGSLCLEGVEALAHRFQRTQLAGVFVCGTTGEFASLTSGERRLLTEKWVEVAPQGFQVMVHVGGTCLAESRELATHARSSGAHAVAAIAPYFFRPSSVGELVAWCREIASAASDLPFYYYHIPALSQVDFAMTDFLVQAATEIPNLAGIKFSHTNLMDAALCVAFDNGRFDILFGVDQALLSALVVGVRGAVGTTYGLTARLSTAIVDAFRARDDNRARELQAKCAEIVAVFLRYGGHPAMKEAMRFVGADCGTVRMPQRRLDAADVRRLREELERVGFFEFAAL